VEEFNNKNTNSDMSGFDSADNTANGYTVTPNGGFYSKPKEEIVQDEVIQQNKNQYNIQGRAPVNYPPKANFDPMTGRPILKNTDKRKSYSFLTVLIACVLAAAISAACSFVISSSISKKSGSGEKVAVGNGAQNNVNITVDKTSESVVEAVAEKVTPSVVGIRTTTSVMDFFGGTSEASGDGSGVVYTQDGYIITNYHVIADALIDNSGKIEVFLDADSESFPATVVGYNISSDLAVVKINAKNLTPIEFDDSDKLKIGQYVITVGNPGGLEFMDSVTYGVISGLNRVVSSDSGVKLIQTDAAINPGNSGGALLNTNGKLVGINSAKIVSEEFEGMGFAIPSNTVKEICDNIIARENAPEPFIGITISERYTAEVLEYYGYPTGAVVLSVSDGSPAAKAGLQRGDIITEYNGKAITEYPVLEDLIMNSTPGDKVSVKIYRSGRYYTTDITVGYNNKLN